MRKNPNFKVEKFRRSGPPRSSSGGFRIPCTCGCGKTFAVLACDGLGWDHVSVSLPDRCPTWQEMCLIRDLFFQDHECVMQLHPPSADHISWHPHCLHLWRPQSEAEIACIRREWAANGEDLDALGVVRSPGPIPRPPADLV